jgi:circadian clock protein KaiC
VGPAGSGKSVIATSYVHRGALDGLRGAMFIFDERTEILLHRAAGLGIDLVPHIQTGMVTVQQVDPAELSPGEFIHRVRRAVAGEDGHPPAKIIVIDSLNGYIHAMPKENFLTAQLHELLTYLGHNGVVTILVMTQSGVIGQMQSPVDTTYLADTVIMLRYFEAEGEVRQALSVVKKRSGTHERTIRELRFHDGVHVGEVLRNFHGVLAGTPVFRGEPAKLLDRKRE